MGLHGHGRRSVVIVIRQRDGRHSGELSACRQRRARYQLERIAPAFAA
jgi:hypothetical protein